MALVLIVEDEPVLRSSMARGLAKLPGITVAEAGTVRAALEAVDAAAPQMIVSDIDLPDRSGLELIGELGRRGLHVPLLFVSAYLKAYGAQIPPHADVDVRDKPIQLDELRSIVMRRVQAGPAPEEPPFGPADYLQLACLGRRSVVIEVASGDARGAIVVHVGTLWTAEDGEGRGEDAFRRLCFFREGATVRVRGLREDPGEQTIHQSWEQLLLDTARQIDERNSSADLSAELDLGEAPMDAAPVEAPRAPPDTGASAFDAVFEAGVTALLVKDYAGAYAAFERARAIRADDAKVLANLERLRQLGHGPPREAERWRGKDSEAGT